MAELTLRHELECTPETYWTKCVFDDEYNRRLYFDALKFPGWTLLEQKDLGDRLVKKVRIDPPVGNLPGAVKKVIGDRLSYVEEGTFDKKASRYSFVVTPSTMAEKTKTAGELWTEPLGERRCVRMFHIRVDVKVMLVGGMVEDKIVQDLKHSYDVAADFTNQFVNEKGY